MSSKASTGSVDRYNTLHDFDIIDSLNTSSNANDGIMKEKTTATTTTIDKDISSSSKSRVKNTIRAKVEETTNAVTSTSTSSSSHRKKRSVTSKKGPTSTTTTTSGGIDTDNAFVYTTPPSGSTDSSNENNYTDDDDDDDENQPFELSIGELLYSSSSYYAIAKPVTLTMILAALAVCLINTDETRTQGANAMADAYQTFHVNTSTNNITTILATSLANAFVIVSAICIMTFGIVCLYRYKFMKCLIGYMMFCSCTLLGLLGGNLAQTAIGIYHIPIDKLSFGLLMLNFAFVGVFAIFFGQGIPKTVTQGYLICTSVILAWHLSYFDSWTIWTLLFMLAIYDLCAVLTPCGPLKALVNLMSRDDAPEMPGLLFEAELPPEAKRPTPARSTPRLTDNTNTNSNPPEQQDVTSSMHGTPSYAATEQVKNTERTVQTNSNRTVKIPLAIAKVYQLPVISMPKESMKIIFPSRFESSNISASPLLTDNDTDMMMLSASTPVIHIPEHLTPQQLRCDVIVQLPPNGGTIVTGTRRTKKVYYEHDRYNEIKRILWVDYKSGKVYAEMKSNDDESPERNSIRLGLGDFIFYSVLVAKAAQYSFSTFAVCTVIILSGLGSTLLLLSIYGHALPALPISIFLGVLFYITTRLFMEPYIEIIMSQPFYV